MRRDYTENELLGLVEEFSSQLTAGLNKVNRKATLEEIRENTHFLDGLKQEYGVYYFLQNGLVKYVGRALPSVKLRSRVLSQINAFNDAKWDTVIKGENVEIGVITFMEPAQWYFASALEHYLIEKLEKPVFNKRC
jgi:hypothetical protein